LFPRPFEFGFCEPITEASSNGRGFLLRKLAFHRATRRSRNCHCGAFAFCYDPAQASIQNPAYCGPSKPLDGPFHFPPYNFAGAISVVRKLSYRSACKLTASSPKRPVSDASAVKDWHSWQRRTNCI
jgi:hypothetical protein